MRNYPHQIGLYASFGVFSWLMIDRGGSSPLWEVTSLGRWSWVYKNAGWARHEDQASKPHPAMISASVPPDFLWWCTVMWKWTPDKAFHPQAAAGQTLYHRTETLRHGNISESTYVTCVDKPCYLSIGSKLTIDVTPKLTVLPSVVNVHDSYHVPLRKQK